MTDAENTPQPAATNAAPPDQVERDWFLQMLVRVANRQEVNIPITLSLRGGIITGMLTSAASFHDHFAPTIASGFQAFDDAGREEIRAAFAKYADEAREAAKDEDTSYSYLHLRHARYLAPGANDTIPNFGNSTMWWRGRVSEVSGFSLGMMEFGRQ